MLDQKIVEFIDKMAQENKKTQVKKVSLGYTYHVPDEAYRKLVGQPKYKSKDNRTVLTGTYNKSLEPYIVKPQNEKTANQDSTGATQAKAKTQTSKRDFEGEGAGLGATIGAVAGALSKKHKSLSTGAGAILGGLLGKFMGARTVSKSTEHAHEGIVKRQEKRKDGTAELPRLNDSKVLQFLESSNK